MRPAPAPSPWRGMAARVATRVVVTAVLLGWAPARALFYDPFPDPASVKPTDELEERIWQESETALGQFVRGEAQGTVAQLQRRVQALVARQWPDWARHFRIFVIDNADVLAVSSANGDIILSTGMLLRLDTEDELQVVLAREIAHVVQRHAVRSVYAARLGAGANVLFQTAVRANSLVGTVGLLSSFQVTPEMLIADGGKAFFQAQVGKLRDNMADNFIRRVSATGFDAMVKTSLFGYSDSLESEADEFALAHMKAKGIETDVFLRVMQRLHGEASVDEKKFSAFYANADRMADRVSMGKKAAGVSKTEAGAPTAAGSATASAQASPAAASSNGPSPASLPSLPAAPVALPADAIEMPSMGGVASVVIGEVAGVPDGSGEASPTGGQAASLAMATQALATSASPEPDRSYEELLAMVAMTVFEAELDAGHLNRAIRNIERGRAKVSLPPEHRLLLAESCWAHPDAKQAERGEGLVKDYLRDKPDDHRALKLMGVIALKRGQIEQARGYLERARQLAPNDDERGFIDQYLRRTDKKVNASL